MPSKALSKVQKHVAKRKGKQAALHENSRDSQRLRRATERDNKLTKGASIRRKLNRPFIDRMEYFQQAAQGADALKPFDLQEIQALISSYIQRDNAELATLKAERRDGRPTSTRQDHLSKQQDLEEKEWLSGFWIPVMTDIANLATLRDWSGNWGALNTMKYCRVAKDGTVRDSSYPPKRDIS